MTAPAVIRQSDGKRTRTSERALTIALKVLKESGLSVDKLLINGAQIEIQCGHVADQPAEKNDGGLEDW